MMKPPTPHSITSHLPVIESNLNRLQAELAPYPNTTLVAVTKYCTLDQMVAAYQCGLRDFGENKIQDVAAKQPLLLAAGCPDIRWHFIGHLQSNKVNKTKPSQLSVPLHLIHSIDSLALAEKLNRAHQSDAHTQAVLLQVNLTGEAQKSGFDEATLLKDYKMLSNPAALPHLAIHGLMAMGPHPADAEASSQCFARLARLRDRLCHDFGALLPHLSMGMSEDYAWALKNGATIIRVGSALFNPAH
ncbi:MAG: YggS family pyridoxal phosphate-dependent enzyme [Cyanobacteria bacterium HKST-UBA06]|nr:YggS family pyridoxal phosphate-dependent enzyme [Cyanobacteria bacterium HKST-UBA06]